MPSRRSHHKSRKGCLTCKRRRVKCDESGLPCTNCKARQTVCEYADPAALSNHDTSPQNTIICSPSLPQSGPFIHAMDETAKRRRTLELRLLHRWSTVTYKTAASDIAQDHEIWQQTVPQVALHYEFLLNAIFAITAFEMASALPRDAAQHLDLALEYQGLAVRSYQAHLKALIDSRIQDPEALEAEESKRREVLVKSLAEYLKRDASDIQSDQLQTLGVELDDVHHDAMLYASTLLPVLALASATATTPPSRPAEAIEGGNMVEQMITCYHLFRGTVIVLMSKPDCIVTHEMLSNLPPFLELQKMPLESDTETALNRIETMNEARVGSGMGEDLAPARAGCRGALEWLRYLFQTCMSVELHDYSLGWFSMAGGDYFHALKGGDHVALLTLLGWGVLMYPLGKYRWYVRDLGKSLIKEVSEIFHGNEDQTVREVISWATGQVWEDGEVPIGRHNSMEIGL